MTAFRGRISRLISTEDKNGTQLYKYLVLDDKGNKMGAKTIREYSIQDEVLVIWTKNSDKYNTPYIKAIKKEKK